MDIIEPPIHWTDYEDIAIKLYEKFGDDFNEFENLPRALHQLVGVGLAIGQLCGQTRRMQRRPLGNDSIELGV